MPERPVAQQADCRPTGPTRNEALLKTSSISPQPSFWAVTSYYNPLRLRSRRQNFKTFRDNLSIPLLTVEHSHEGRFELGSGDSDLLIQVQGGDLMWQKERLLNIGFSQLPASCERVAWLDCDLLFCDPEVWQRAEQALGNHQVLQLFEVCHHLAPGATRLKQGVLQSHESITSTLCRATDRRRIIEQLCSDYRQQTSTDKLPGTYRAMGFAWAAQRSWLEAIGGLFDRSIIGSGDSIFVCAAAGFLSEYRQALKSNTPYRDSSSLQEWQRRVEQSSPRLNYIQGNIAHLFHGHLQDRGYFNRHLALNATGFNADRDLIAADHEAWSFAATCPAAVRELMPSYFSSRREDD